MKELKNIIFTMVMMGLVLVVYFNLDIISAGIAKFLSNDKDVLVNEGNQYTRDYDYIAFTYDEDYSPLTKEDIKNIYFNVLNNGFTSFTFYCPNEYTTCISDAKEIRNDKELLSKINNYVHPFNSYVYIDTFVYDNGEVRIEIIPKYDDEEILKINKKVEKIKKELMLEGKTNREKIEIIHNYLITNIKYDNDKINGESIYDSTSAYGSLIEGVAVCSGYSDAMAIFLDSLDIPNLKLSSKDHIWNLVYIDNEWLHLDLTWDDTENERYNNNYFLITKEKLFSLDGKEHKFDEGFYLEAF